MSDVMTGVKDEFQMFIENFLTFLLIDRPDEKGGNKEKGRIWATTWSGISPLEMRVWSRQWPGVFLRMFQDLKRRARHVSQIALESVCDRYRNFDVDYGVDAVVDKYAHLSNRKERAKEERKDSE